MKRKRFVLEASSIGKITINADNDFDTMEETFCMPNANGSQFTKLFNNLKEGDRILISFEIKEKKSE